MMKRTTYLSLVIALVMAMFSSCGEDRTHEYYDLTQENQWTYSKMQVVYLWRDMIKEPSRSTFFSTTTKFFSSLLYSGDKISFFTDTVSAGSYGITFAVMRDPIGERPSKAYALVLMVEPGSPADIAGVERGTWISSVGGTALTTSRYSMLQSGGNTNLVTEYIDYDDDVQRYCWNAGDTLQIGASRDCSERALYLDTVYTVRSKNVGYLVINNFNGDDFIDRTQNALLRFAASEVNEVVIDLRYCSGGSIVNAASLASSFVDPELYGTAFCNLLDADGETDTTYCYAAQQTSLSENRLHVIIGEQTAGAGELFVTALNKSRSMYDLMIFGAKSKGVNTMTSRFESPYGFAINPATNYIALSGGEQLTAVAPDYSVSELQHVENIHPLGSEQEYMLYNILYYSTNGALPQENGNMVDVTFCRQGCKPFIK